MKTSQKLNNFLKILFVFIALLAVGCSTPTEQPAPATPTPVDLPEITSSQLDRPEVPNFEAIAIKVAVAAKYENPYDQREVSLDAVFTAPDGTTMNVPGYWDGEADWWVRFTPSQVGAWTYAITVRDARGSSLPAGGQFTVTDSDLHGWLRVGSQVNPAYSPRYLVYQDGTPFYGIGHCDALNIFIDSVGADGSVNLFDNMKAAGENFVVWWPLYGSSPIASSYDSYSVASLKTIDMVVSDAQKEGIFLVFTVWDHPELRAKGHAWGEGRWEGYNGFRKLGTIDEFFTSDEAWAWQENFYRYIIARWGYSPAIGMWQTVSEVNGTNAYDQTDAWHKKVNDYFIQNDPYRHPTTASKSGDTDWPDGYATMDAPQVHVYDLETPVDAAQTSAYWTQLMWDRAEKPNWIGEFGVTANTQYPELFHNFIWAALGSGAAMTPAEWNSGGQWMRMTPEMNADINRLGLFVADIPLAHLNPSRLEVASSDPQVRGWGVAGRDGGLVWVQDFALAGKSIQDVRADQTIRSGVTLQLTGLAGGDYTLAPYDTWQGTYLAPVEVSCTEGQLCEVSLPDFKADLAFKITRK